MEKFDEVVTLWDATDSNPNESTRIEFDRNEERGDWQISLENGPFSGYPTISLDRKRLEDLYSVLEQELYPERFQKPSFSNRVLRLKAGNFQFGCAGRHVGNGKDCSTIPHHHHDEFCDPPTPSELNAAGVDPLVFRQGYFQQRFDAVKAYQDTRTTKRTSPDVD